MLNCEAKVKVLNVYSKTASNGKTYHHLIVCPVNGGDTSDLGCTEGVAKEVKQCSNYICKFDINPFYLRKEYSCSLVVKEVELIK